MHFQSDWPFISLFDLKETNEGFYVFQMCFEFQLFYLPESLCI